MTTRIRPMLGKIAVKYMQTEEVSRGGIILPGGRQEITSAGTVVEVCEPYTDGNGFSGPNVAVGDKVVFGKYSGVELTIDRDKYVVLRETDLLARLEDAQSSNS